MGPWVNQSPPFAPTNSFRLSQHREQSKTTLQSQSSSQIPQDARPNLSWRRSTSRGKLSHWGNIGQGPNRTPLFREASNRDGINIDCREIWCYGREECLRPSDCTQLFVGDRCCPDGPMDHWTYGDCLQPSLCWLAMRSHGWQHIGVGSCISNVLWEGRFRLGRRIHILVGRRDGITSWCEVHWD